MKLPDLTQQTRPIPTAEGGVARYQPESASAAMAPGNALAQLGGEFQQMVARETERADQLRAEDAFNQLRQKQQDLTLGETGFINRKGADAVTKPLMRDYSTQFDDAANQISESLGTPRQKELFRSRAGVAGLQFRDELLRHVVREGDVYEEQVFKGAASVERANTSTHWNEPDAIALSVTRIESLVKQRAARLGLPKEAAESFKIQMLGDLHESVIDQALANKEYAYAEKWFNDHKDQMDQQTQDKLAPVVDNGVQKQLANLYNTRYLASENDFKALTALKKDVLSDGTLDEDRKNILVGRLQNQQEVLLNRAERAQAQRERKIELGIQAVNAITLQGFEPTAEQMAPLVDGAKGTQFEPMVKQMIAVANLTRKYRLSTPAQQEQMQTDLEVAARKDPTKFDVTLISRFKAIKEAQGELLKKDPVTFAIRQGLLESDSEAAKPLDLSHPETMGEQLKARFDLARDMNGRYGASMKPLTSQEVGALNNYLANVKPQQRRNYLSLLAAVTKDDKAGYTALMGQIAPDDPVTAIAGLRALNDPIAADLLIHGQELLRPDRKADGTPAGGKLWPMPSQEMFERAFRGIERDTFAGAPQTRSDYYQATQSIYAALSAKAGDSNATVVNSDRLEQAVKMATGGIGKYNGKHIALPYGMDIGDFEDRLDARITFLAGSGRLAEGMTRNKLEDLPLENAGEGKYVFRAGDGLLKDRAGKRVTIDFNLPMESEQVQRIPK